MYGTLIVGGGNGTSPSTPSTPSGVNPSTVSASGSTSNNTPNNTAPNNIPTIVGTFLGGLVSGSLLTIGIFLLYKRLKNKKRIIRVPGETGENNSNF